MALRDQKERLDREIVFLNTIFTGSAHARSPVFQSVLSVYALRVSGTSVSYTGARTPGTSFSWICIHIQSVSPDYIAKVENNEEKIQQKQEK